MIKNVVLDIGGVLVDYHTVDYYTKKGCSEEEAKALKAATMDSPYWVQNDIALLPYSWCVGRMKAMAPGLAPQIDKYLERQYDIVTRRKESKDWIESLRKMGYRILVLSNFSEVALRDCPEAMDFLDENLGGGGRTGEYGIISEGILSCKVHMVKPYPSIYALLLTRYGLIPEETVFVDDTQKNLTAASFYGIHTILFQSREQVMEDLKQIQD